MEPHFKKEGHATLTVVKGRDKVKRRACSCREGTWGSGGKIH
jgi:hypothetical protein